jgi:very-short-patch-repair endonuclease
VRGKRGFSSDTQQRAKQLRRDMTDAERKLWSALRGAQLGAKFRRQQPIGPFIADFFCPSANLIVEADGGQHVDNASDVARTRWLEARGYRIVRFWNNDILTNLDGVCRLILESLNSPHPPTATRRAPPSPSRGEGFGDIHA